MGVDDLGRVAEWARKVVQKLEKKGRLLVMVGIRALSGGLHVCLGNVTTGNCHSMLLWAPEMLKGEPRGLAGLPTTGGIAGAERPRCESKPLLRRRQ